MQRDTGAPVSALMCSDRRLSCSKRPSAAGTLVSLLEFKDLVRKGQRLGELRSRAGKDLSKRSKVTVR